MTLLRYRDINFRGESLDQIGRVNSIIAEYQGRGYLLTLRQLYYQLVARGVIENTPRSYQNLGGLVSDGRMAGLISWDAIEDRARNLKGLATHSGPEDVLEAAAESYRMDLWRDQPTRPEVWVEKEALEGVLARICNELRVDFFACKGYVSQSELWRAGQRMAGYIRRGQRPVIIHLGDHDPSGLDMTRDNAERLQLFTGVPVQVIRVALNMEQVRQLRPPPNPAKVTDSRFEDYRRRHGEESWELDALRPDYIHNLIRTAVEALRDPRLWDEALRREVSDREWLLEMARPAQAD